MMAVMENESDSDDWIKIEDAPINRSKISTFQKQVGFAPDG